jgi:hypothetical protein
MARQRERIVWTPVWTEEYTKWTRGFVRSNRWRCDPLYDKDDLEQEAFFVFAHVAATYPRIIDPGHFLALFKRAMINKMHDRSCRYNRRKGTVEAPISVDIYETFSGRIGEVTNSGYVAALYSEAPEELKLVMNILAEGSFDPPAKNRREAEQSPTISARLCRALGVPAGSDPIAEIRQLLTT